MWSHYAQNHSGFCLEFSTCNDVLSLAYKVEYSSTYPAHDLTDDRDIRPFVSKSDVWEYECEYRFVGVVDGSGEAKDMDASLIVNSNNLLQLPAESLVSVIVGCQMPVSGCEEVRRLIERYDRRVQFKRAVRVPDRYDLVIELED